MRRLSANIIENDLSLPIFYGHNRQAKVMFNYLLTKVNPYFNKIVNKMTNASIERKKLTLKQTMFELKKLSKLANMTRTDELDADFLDEVEFLLGLKGRWLLCHMKKDYPFTIRFRLIWESSYKRVKPKDFIEAVSKILLH